MSRTCDPAAESARIIRALDELFEDESRYDANRRTYANLFRNVYNRAYVKGAEIFEALYPSGEGPQLALLNAEAPGGFVFALMDMFPDAEWVANSLRDEPGALGDRYGLMKKTRERWAQFSQPGFSGDIMDPDAAEHLQSALDGRKVDLYTSDLGISIEGSDWGCQEELHLELHARAAALGTAVLRRGGDMVLKGYSYLEKFWESQELDELFETVEYFKPVSSNPVNREIYLLCRGYLGKPLALPDPEECVPERGTRSDAPGELCALWESQVRAARLWERKRWSAADFRRRYLSRLKRESPRAHALLSRRRPRARRATRARSKKR